MKMGKQIFTLALALLAISQASALRCWRCSSDIANSEYCADPFNPSAMSEPQRKWSYVDCALPSNIDANLVHRARPACKRIIQQINEKIVFARACTWELEGAAPDACKYSTVNFPDVKMMYCETCLTDGCNGDNKKVLSIYDPNKTTEKPATGSSSGLLVNRFTLGIVALVAFFWGF